MNKTPIKLIMIPNINFFFIDSVARIIGVKRLVIIGWILNIAIQSDKLMNLKDKNANKTVRYETIPNNIKRKFYFVSEK